ncbi:MAG: hypothetical protein GXP04_06910 [Alphaproteobacteria bacterium]|nr:hypothetical protein [Alphaproteobacteria bacterium]
MKLYHSQTSPFVRTVLVVLDHHCLLASVETVSLDLFCGGDRQQLLMKNPVGKIPALELDDGEVIFDSSVIVDYIDEIGHGAGLFDSKALSPHRLRTFYALSNGMMDAAVSSVMEVLQRSEELQSEKWLARWEESIMTSVRQISICLPQIRDTGLMPELSFVVALDYLNFRLPHIEWQAKYPKLAIWVKEQLKQDIYRKTDPRLAK